MRREYVQWLRGDAIKEAVDINSTWIRRMSAGLTWHAYHSWEYEHGFNAFIKA